MAVDKFLIAPLNSGLQKDVEPWLIMDDAFDELVNVRVWRGRVKKRYGYHPMNTTVGASQQQLLSRLRIQIGTTDPGTGDFVTASVPGTIYKVGQIFSIGTTIFTVNATGAPAVLLTTGTATGTYNTTTGALNITGNNENPSTAVYFYPAEPVMHFSSYQRPAVNDEQLIAFDTQFAYSFTQAGGWVRLGTATWTGSNSDFHWSTNYRGVSSSDFLLFVVNNVVADTIKYWNNSAWTNFSPVYDNSTGRVIRTALLVLPFKDRLLLLNTTEQGAAGDDTFRNRIRFSQNGSPIATDAFHQVAGKGGFIEAPTKEAIISAEYVKDRLIVFFEESTWELVYTGNRIAPFSFQQINTELGVESTHSIIPFDKYAMGFGSTGVHVCNGMNVERIDQKIPDVIFRVSNENSGPQRVAAIRDYWTEEVYWSFNSSKRSAVNSDVYPNQVLVYNYQNGSWAINYDSITAFGYYQNEDNRLWEDMDYAWEETEDQWSDPSLQQLFKNIVAGNQEGFTYIIDNEKTSTGISLSITDITFSGTVVTITIINHNLLVNESILIENAQGITSLNNTIVRINSTPTADTITVIASVSGTYTGGGTATTINPIGIVTKRYNFYNTIGKRMAVQRLDLLVTKTENGQIGYDYRSSFNTELLLGNSITNGVSQGSNILETIPLTTFEKTQNKIWRSLYPILEGDTVQFIFTFTGIQIVNESIVNSDFQIHAFIFHVRTTDDFGG